MIHNKQRCKQGVLPKPATPTTTRYLVASWQPQHDEVANFCHLVGHAFRRLRFGNAVICL